MAQAAGVAAPRWLHSSPCARSSGLREEINPTILAVATLLIVVSILLLTALKLLLEGIEPGRRRKRYEMPKKPHENAHMGAPMG